MTSLLKSLVPRRASSTLAHIVQMVERRRGQEVRRNNGRGPQNVVRTILLLRCRQDAITMRERVSYVQFKKSMRAITGCSWRWQRVWVSSQELLTARFAKEGR